MMLEQYNQDLTLTPEEDAAFEKLACERTARHRWTYFGFRPQGPDVVVYATDRVAPGFRYGFSVSASWKDDRIDQSVTVGLFLLKFSMLMAIWGGIRLCGRAPARGEPLALLATFVLVRTRFSPRWKPGAALCVGVLSGVTGAGRKSLLKREAADQPSTVRV